MNVELKSLKQYLFDKTTLLDESCFIPTKKSSEILHELYEKIFKASTVYWKSTKIDDRGILSVEPYRNENLYLELKIEDGKLIASYRGSSIKGFPHIRIAELHLDHNEFLRFIYDRLKNLYLSSAR